MELSAAAAAARTAWAGRPGIDRLLEALGAADGQVQFVGGAVRDALLGEAVGDLDMATRLAPQDVIRRLEAAHIKAIPTGLAHGTITAVSHGTVVEVTTLRADVETDGRRARVAFTDDWAADAARRDFTINALYADPLDGTIFDPVGGLADLAARRVRFIGDPAQRIAEDHLRILRFFRFHARFGSGAPDPAALAACQARANDLMALSRERIADEMLKLLPLAAAPQTVRLMHDSGIFAPVLPEITPAGLDALDALAAAEAEAGIAPDALRRLAALLPADPASVEKVAARLKLSNKAKKRLASAATRPGTADRPPVLAYRLGAEGAIDALLLAGAPGAAASLVEWTVPRLPISGGDLIARGLSQGPAVARTLKAIEAAWLAAGFPEGQAFELLVETALRGGDAA